MSFSSECKTEMCKTPIERVCCARAELYGCFLLGSKLAPDEIRVLTGHEGVATRLPLLLKAGFGLDFDYSDKLERKQLLTLTDTGKLEAVLTAFGHDEALRVAVHLNRSAIEDECCMPAFARGAFLSGGFASSPEKEYHLEIITPHAALSRQLAALLSELDLPPKTAMRAGHRVLYYKSSEFIEDFLTLCGAPVCAMSIMEAKVEKDFRNNINRKVNCEAANLSKTVGAGMSQCEVVRRLMRSTKWDELPETLKRAAELRLEHPEDTLGELARLGGISKSGMNHRLRKLMELENV